MSTIAILSGARNLSVPFQDCADIMERPVTRERLIPGLQDFCNTSRGRCYQVNECIPNPFVPLGATMAGSSS